ncbi:homoserine O-acetyltransferase family protein [Cyclobacterium plantarum]|uniref:Homoserine O-acetyltransferase n=1 Tax=Cyclobacterium plantarum TaxID=2716263 RepID=A0ABX0HBC1_9BACT|nr:homoserine O-acetyltransferase [Cyclobacterium plantarum]NHE57457.1 homoserine O-acetyltransferase [Cyclobacterium plantarum]
MNLQSPHLSIEMTQEIFYCKEALHLESGEILPEFQLSFTTQGQLNDKKDNVVWVLHALTGDANPQEWWAGLIGEDKFYDPSRHFIICANFLGSCYGSTQPLSVNPGTGKPYYYDFPNLTTRDIAASMDKLRLHLGLDQIDTVIGGSLGGQVALEWAYTLKERLNNAIIIASNAKASPWIIGFNETQRMAIESDQTWGSMDAKAGKKGLETARAIGMLSYRHPQTFIQHQSETEEKRDNFKISSYLRYQGMKLANRFNALSYWTLSKAMDSHDLGRARGGTAAALAKIQCKVLSIGIDTDLLFTFVESRFISLHVPKGTYREISSLYGHDAFLIEYEQLQYILQSFYLENNHSIRT